MKNERGEITIEGFYDNVLPQTALEQKAMAQLSVDLERVKQSIGLQRLDEPVERGFFERLTVRPA